MKFRAIVRNGLIYFYDKHQKFVDIYLKGLDNVEITIEFGRYYKDRTGKQNRFYNGVVLEAALEVITDNELITDKKSANKFFLQECAKELLVDRNGDYISMSFLSEKRRVAKLEEITDIRARRKLHHVFLDNKGVVWCVPKTTSQMNVKEMSIFLNKVLDYLCKNYGVNIEAIKQLRDD